MRSKVHWGSRPMLFLCQRWRVTVSLLHLFWKLNTAIVLPSDRQDEPDDVPPWPYKQCPEKRSVG